MKVTVTIDSGIIERARTTISKAIARGVNAATKKAAAEITRMHARGFSEVCAIYHATENRHLLAQVPKTMPRIAKSRPRGGAGKL
jgi:hypothetical protein